MREARISRCLIYLVIILSSKKDVLFRRLNMMRMYPRGKELDADFDPPLVS